MQFNDHIKRSQHLSDNCFQARSHVNFVRHLHGSGTNSYDCHTNLYGSRAILKNCMQIARKMGMFKSSLRRCDRLYGVANSYDSRAISSNLFAIPIASDRKAVVRLM